MPPKRKGKACKFHLCPSRSKLHPHKKFYPFVKPWIDRDKCLRWISATGNKNLTTVFIDKSSYVCQDHFVNGSPSAEYPDPLAVSSFELASDIYPPEEQFIDNLFANADLDEESVDDPSQQRTDQDSGGYVACGAVTTENRDSLPYDSQAVIVDAPGKAKASCTLNSPCHANTSPARRVALALKKKSISPKKTSRFKHEPYRVHTLSPKVTDANETASHGLRFSEGDHCSEQATEDVVLSGSVCTSVPPADNGSRTQRSADLLTSPMIPGAKVHKHRRLFPNFMVDAFENDSDGNEEVSPLGRPIRDDSAENTEEQYCGGNRGKCSVRTQTLSVSYVNKLIAAGKLAKWRSESGGRQTRVDDTGTDVKDKDADDSKVARVVTTNYGGQITISECDDANDERLDEPTNAETSTSHMTSENEERPRVDTTSRGGGGGSPRLSSDEEDVEADDVEAEDHERENASKQRQDGGRYYVSYETITCDEDFEYLCGLSRRNFDVLYRYLGGDEVCSRLKYETVSGTPRQLRASRITYKGRLFMTLCRLRRGFTERELSIMFGCSVSLVSRILNTWINFLFLEFKPLEEEMFQDRKSQKRGMHPRFKSFKNLRVIIDCFEINIERASNLQQQGNTWSTYKHHNTVKYLVGINCRGAVIYVSEAFEGSMSDKEVFIRSSLYDLLRPRDTVMADRGFDIAHELDLIKVDLVIPSYLKGRDYLTPEEEIWSKKIARSRIFVENAIARIRNWRILNTTFPQSTLPLVSQMVFVCACLTNFLPAMI